MAKSKFKIGDRVTVTDKSDSVYGMTGTIVDYQCGDFLIQFENWHGGHNGYPLNRDSNENNCWFVQENDLSLATETIVIYRNGNIVTALDKSTGKRAEAHCNPTDKFDFHVGAKLAFERLTESKDDKMIEDDEIKVGDMVIVVNLLGMYIAYADWTGLKEYIGNYVFGKTPLRGKKYIVRNIAKHDTFDSTLALIQDLDTTQVFIISIDGIKKAN
jgi:hypothetical protein